MEGIPPKPPCAFGEGGEPPGPKANALLLSFTQKPPIMAKKEKLSEFKTFSREPATSVFPKRRPEVYACSEAKFADGSPKHFVRLEDKYVFLSENVDKRWRACTTEADQIRAIFNTDFVTLDRIIPIEGKEDRIYNLQTRPVDVGIVAKTAAEKRAAQAALDELFD